MRPARSPHTRRGNAAATITAVVPVMGFLALVVDIGVLQSAQSQLQVGVDAAALAGAGYLDGTASGVERARKMTIEVAAHNAVLGKSLSIHNDDVAFGYHDSYTGSFVESDDPARIDAVLVSKDVADITTSFAAGAFGQKFMETSASAMASQTRSGVGATACFFPIAIPDCFLTGGDEVEPFTVRMSSAQEDNAGWADLDSYPSAAIVRDQLEGACSGGIATVDDQVYLNNGQITTALDTVASMLSMSTLDWNEDELGSLPDQMSGSTHKDYGKVIEGPIIIFHPDDGVCGSSTQFNQSAPIVGFAWAVVYDVKVKGSDKTIQVYIDPGYEQTGGLGGGGIDSNFTFVSIGLVD